MALTTADLQKFASRSRCPAMKHSLRRPGELIGDILNAGIRLILLVAAIQFFLVIVSIGVGGFVWFNRGFLSGLVSGVATFLVGQSIAVTILDIILLVPEKSTGGGRDLSEQEVMESLRAELESKSERYVPPGVSR